MSTQQGKAYTGQQKQKIIKSLSTYLKLGYSLKKACELAKFQYNTIWNWTQKDPVLLIKINAWQSTISVKARKVLVGKIQKGDVGLSKWWLERMEKEDFNPNYANITKPENMVVHWHETLVYDSEEEKQALI